jgi:hypothetical protein
VIRFISTWLAFLFILCNLSFGQGNTDSTQTTILENLQSQQIDTTRQAGLTPKSPLGAVLRSLAIPGWGQLYVQQYWKAPIFFAGAVVMYYYVFKHNKDYLDYSSQYDKLKETSPNSIELYYLKSKKENARDNRDISIFFLCGVYALAMLDSYVDAHLFNFNVNENLSLGITNRNGGVFLSLQFRR